MKTLLFTIALLLSSPYLIGKFQYHNACEVIANIGDQTDGEIEDALAVFNFYNTDCMSEPTQAQYYISGILTIQDLTYSI